MRLGRPRSHPPLSASSFKPRRVLLVSPNPIGDAVMAEPAMRSIAQRFAGARIDLVVSGPLAAIGRAMPFINRIVPMAMGGGMSARLQRVGLVAALALARYDLCVLFPNSRSSARIARLAGIPRIAGYARDGRERYLSDPLPWPPGADREHMIAYYGRIAELLGCRPPTDAERSPDSGDQAVPGGGCACPRLDPDAHSLESAARLLAECGCGGSFFVFAPGAAFGGAKRWPAGHYAALARALCLRTGWPIVLLGGADDRALGEQIVAAAGLEPRALINLCGRADLSTALGIIARCTGFVGNDSGPAHIAAALGRPGVTLFGSSSAARSGPVAAGMRALSIAVPCAPCFERECAPGHLDCLNGLTPDRALGALEAVAGLHPGLVH